MKTIILFITLIVFITTNVSAINDKVSSFTLKNGMEVVVIPDHRAPVVSHMVWYKVGAADEPAGMSGVAHFLEHLMFKGTKNIPDGEFSKIVAENGGRENAFTSQDYTGYYQKVAKDRLEIMMKIEADRMTNLVLTDEQVIPERNVVLEERRLRTDNNPSSRLEEQLNATLYLSHPYNNPVIGWEHEIKNLNSKNAIDFYKMFYTPNNAILIVAGDITEKELRPLAEKYYGAIAIQKKISPRVRPQEPPHQAARRVELKDKRVANPSMRRYYLTPSYSNDKPGEAEALDILSQIIGGGTTSRIYKRLIIEKKLANSAGAWFIDGLDNGEFAVYAEASSLKKLKKSEQEIDNIISDIIANGVTIEELKDAKNNLLAEAVYALDSQFNMARIFGVSLTSGLKIKDVIKWPERIEKITAKQVQDVAKKFLKIERSATGLLLKDH